MIIPYEQTETAQQTEPQGFYLKPLNDYILVFISNILLKCIQYIHNIYIVVIYYLLLIRHIQDRGVKNG